MLGRETWPWPGGGGSSVSTVKDTCKLACTHAYSQELFKTFNREKESAVWSYFFKVLLLFLFYTFAKWPFVSCIA
jgi:hypothetical protein